MDGGSTKAFGVGLVGNATDAASTSQTSSSSSASGSPSSSSSTRAQSSPAASQTSSPNDAMNQYGGDMMIGLLGVLALSLAGMIMVM